MKLHTLEVQLWGREKQIWTRDIDRSISDDTLRDFAAVCGTSIDKARETCLRSYEGTLFQTLIVNGNSNWILPFGIRHRKRKRHGMQFCPLCLATDEYPYFRKSWRLAFSTFCDLHDVMLHDRCPQCKSPVMFHRQELGDRWSWQVMSLSFCTSCGFDLKRSPTYQASAVEIHTWNAIKAQRLLLESGWVIAGAQTFAYAHLYFDVLRNLIRNLLSTRKTSQLMVHSRRELGLDDEYEKRVRTSFEYLDVGQRHTVVQIATWLLLDWPHKFLQMASEARLRHSELMAEFEDPPYWFANEVRCLEINPLGPSPGEKDAMRALWQMPRSRADRQFLKRQILKRIGNGPIKEFLGEETHQ